MKRISTATIAAATALALTTVPAIAQDVSTGTNSTVAATTVNETAVPASTTTAATTPVATTTAQAPVTTTATQPAPNNSGGSSRTAVGLVSGLSAALITTGLIVFADPRGANMIIDFLNREFNLGIPHLNVPKVQIPNFQLPF